MTEQEAYDTAVRGLASQGFAVSGHQHPDYDPDEGYRVQCLYTSEVGHCAVGWLIPDIVLTEFQNGTSVAGLRGNNDAVAERLAGLSEQFLDHLQQCHDYGETPSEMRFRLYKFAQRYGLTIPEVLR